MNPFLQEFDEILNKILVDYRNQLPGCDTSKGSMAAIKAACLASGVWGINAYQAWIARQIFSDTADPEYMEHHAWTQGIFRKIGESDADLLARDLEIRRRPPAGGNRYDFIRWAKEVDHIVDAYCIPWGQGAGTIDVVIIADKTFTGAEIPSAYVPLEGGLCTGVGARKLIDAGANFTWTTGTIYESPFDGGGPVRPGDIVRNTFTGASSRVAGVDTTTLSLTDDIFPEAGHGYHITSLTRQCWLHIEDVRPVRATIIRILPPATRIVDIDMVVEGNANVPWITGEIQAMMLAMRPGESLFLDQLRNKAVQGGAFRVPLIAAPANDVIATSYDLIRPGVINVRKA